MFYDMYVYNFSGQTQTISVGVQPANNFPVDIYYLMDQSFSMIDDLDSLRNLAEELGQYIVVLILIVHCMGLVKAANTTRQIVTLLCIEL